METPLRRGEQPMEPGKIFQNVTILCFFVAATVPRDYFSAVSSSLVLANKMRFPRYRMLFRAFFATLILGQACPSQAEVLLRIAQVGPDVVLTGSGSANLAGLIFDRSKNNWSNYLSSREAYAGPDFNGNGGVGLYSGLTGPLAFGSDPDTLEPPSDSSSGDFFGILVKDDTGRSLLVLPSGYSTGNPLSGESIFTSVTLSVLGLAPGQVSTWTWGSGANADSLRLEVVPAPAPLLGVVAGFRFARALRRRQLACRAESAAGN